MEYLLICLKVSQNIHTRARTLTTDLNTLAIGNQEWKTKRDGIKQQPKKKKITRKETST